MKPAKISSEELAAQTAAFLASGGEVKELDQIENPKVAQARFYNTTDKIIYSKVRGKGTTKSKMALLRGSRSTCNAKI
jgi:hypothetical protein